jgi:hypothetical protein
VEAAPTRISVEHDCCPRCTERARYLRTVADQLGLRHWVVEVDHEPTEGDALAEVRLALERRRMRVRYAVEFDQADEEEQRLAVCHEVLHCHHRDLFQTVEAGVRDELGGAAFRLFIGSVRRDLERMVDALSEVVAPTVPLPSNGDARPPSEMQG